MPKYDFTIHGVMDAIEEGSVLYKEGITLNDDGVIEQFLAKNWEDYFVSEWDFNEIEFLENWEANLKPGSNLDIERWEELCEKLGSDFDSWLINRKARINLTVSGEIPELLRRLAGSERRMGHYVTNLIREDFMKKQEAGFDFDETNALAELKTWAELLQDRHNSIAVKPDTEFATSEPSSIEERLRKLERAVEELTRIGDPQNE